MYVGSAEDEKYDQELDSVLVGPVVVGKNKFVFQAPAPDPALIPAKDLMEVTVLLLTCSYKDKEFIRIGYYVNNEYPASEEELQKARDAWTTQVGQMQADYASAVNVIKEQEEAMRQAGQMLETNLPLPPQPLLPPPPAVDILKLNRNILADKPRVTRFQILWDEPEGGAQGSNEFAMEAADEAAANAEATSMDNEATTQAAADGANIADEEEDEEDDDDEEMDENMDDEDDDDDDGEEGDEEEKAEAPAAAGQTMRNQGMHVE